MENEKLILFLEPKNADTNQMIADGLKSLSMLSDADFSSEDKKARWECPYNLVSSFVQKRKTNKLVKFSIWIKKGSVFSSGEFLFQKRKTKKKPLK